MKAPNEIILDLCRYYPTIKDFARAIGEDSADIVRWRMGKCKIKPRAVVAICRLYPKVKPYQLNSSCFPEDLTFKFSKDHSDE